MVQSIVQHGDCRSVVLDGCGYDNRGVSRTLLLPFDRLRPAEPAVPRLQPVRRRAWAHCSARALLDLHPFGGLTSLVGATIDILPFQLEPALAMLRHGTLRILLADEVGLGKTVQAGILLRELATRERAFRGLIVTPAGLREQWQRELEEKFALGTVLADTTWLAIRTRELPADVNPWALPGIYVASLDLVKRPEVLCGLEDVTWDLAVIDEVHNAGEGTGRLAAADAVAARSRRVMLLTATPPHGDPAHLAAIADLGRLRGAPITEFRRTRAVAGSGRKTLLLPVQLSPAEQKLHRLLEHYTSLVWTGTGARHDTRARLAAVVLRKRALSSAASLGLSVRRRLALISSPQAPIGEQLALPWGDEDPLADEAPDDILGVPGLDDAGRERALLEQIATAADEAAAVESKLAFLLRFVERVREPMVIFTEYRDTLFRIASVLAARRPLLLHGEMLPRERTAVQTTFNRDGGILLGTDAASEGLNLHHRCRLVVHFELPWTPMRLEQRTGRVDRFGQARRVHEVLLVARDTAERLVLAPLLKRVRAAAVEPGRALHALDESAVAAALMDGVDVASPPLVPSPSTQRLDLRDEAAAEAERLLLHRRLRMRVRTQFRGGGDLPVTVAARWCDRVMALVAVSLVTRSGQVLHSELVAIRVPGAARVADLSSREARWWAERFIQTCEVPLLQYAREHTARGLDGARTEIRAQAEVERARDRAIVAALAPAAQRLVQAGLFDRRAVNEAKRRQDGATVLLENATARLASDAAHEIETQARIIALRGWREPEPRPAR